MEENVAILIADLTGYTALTETHGAVSAADLIDRYLDIVEGCLVGDSQLTERTGDEVMIVSQSPDYLLASAYMIMKASSNEDNFLQVHGGLHYGKLLKRRASYFGSALNLTARIAAKADPGTFWCSGEFINSLSDRSLVKLSEKGKHSFKNISEQQEMYELRNEGKASIVIDPVCRMIIRDTTKAIWHPGFDDVYFCSNACLEKYIRDKMADARHD